MMVPEDRAVRLEQMEHQDRRENVVTAEPAEETDLLELLVLPDRRVMWETADPMVSLDHKDPKENQVRGLYWPAMSFMIKRSFQLY